MHWQPEQSCFVTGNPLGKSSPTSPKIRNYLPIECLNRRSPFLAASFHHLPSLVLEWPQHEPIFPWWRSSSSYWSSEFIVLPHIWKTLMPIGMDLEKKYMNGMYSFPFLIWRHIFWKKTSNSVAFHCICSFTLVPFQFDFGRCRDFLE